MKVAVTVAIAVVVMMVSFALAQSFGFDDRGNPNDPFVNERANACYDGGSLEGRCKTDLEWNAGWYLIRFERGIFTREQIPSQYAWVLPPIGGNDSSDDPSSGESISTNLPPTSSLTAGPTPISTATGIETNTPTNTPTSTETGTPTDTPTSTETGTPTGTPTDTPTSTETGTPTDTPTSTETGTPTNTPTSTETPTP